MPFRSRLAASFAPAIAVCLALGLGGCSMDDVQLNGGIFDAVGLNDAKPGRAETKMTERAPLIVPPTLDNLPQPGQAEPPSQIVGINDPDAAKQKSQAELEAQQQAYCDKNYRDAGMRGEEVAMVEGPLGPCRKSVLTAIKKWNQGDAQEGQ